MIPVEIAGRVRLKAIKNKTEKISFEHSWLKLVRSHEQVRKVFAVFMSSERVHSSVGGKSSKFYDFNEFEIIFLNYFELKKN